MTLVTVKGVYRDGLVEIPEAPSGTAAGTLVLVTFLMQEVVLADDKREQLRQKFLARLRRGEDFGKEPLPTREELYAERLDRFR